MVAGVELNYDINASALEMAETIFGDGVTVVGASYTGDNRASAIYTDGDTISPGVVPSDSGVILSTGDSRAFTRTGSQSNVSSSTTTSNNGPNNDPDFNAAAGGSTFDASYLDIDFVPDADVEFITLQFVLASEEYPEFAGSIYNDQVGVWMNGSPVALPAGNGQASVGNINQSGGVNLFQDNTGDQFNTEMDGFTVTLSMTIPVTPGEVNSLRIGIADVADSQYDSNVLIAADSVQGSLIAVEDDVLLRPGTEGTLDALANDVNNTGGTVSITQINGIDVAPGDSVVLTTGQTVTLNGDGTLSLVSENESEDVAFTYGVTSSTGEFDVGFINIDTVPCFTAGTRIRTPDGDRPVQSLCPGDLVLTRDNGPQPVRWIGRRTTPATDRMAPVRIAANTFGHHGRLTVSPLHRILVSQARGELLFGATEVLVAARDLVDGGAVQQVPGGWVEYVHLMFDEHQILWSEGLPTESFLPGPQTTSCFDKEAIAEIAALFPELDPATGKGYGPAARALLKPYEARLLVA
ncbi:MAG: Hint domain-containing protein [Paracoccaceae bacterium]|nr:Hint domain-containing protein [Paracoccaceae bacterium]